MVQECALAIIWRVADLPRWGFQGTARHTIAVENLNVHLQRWYEVQRRLGRSKGDSEICPLNLAMLGTIDHPLLHAKGAESAKLFRFLMEIVLPQYRWML